MKKYRLSLDDTTAEFYEKAAKNLDIPIENLMEKALFSFAGEVSVSVLKNKN